MKNKKIISVIFFSIMGLSFVYANESIISIINDSEIEDVRKVGRELCSFFVHKEKSYMRQIQDFMFGTTPEKKIAISLYEVARKYPEVTSSIFSGQASDNKIMRDLQEGCFDFLTEEILSLAHGLNETITSHNETLLSIATIHCIDPSSNKTIRNRDFIRDSDFEDYKISLLPCTDKQLNSHNTLTETASVGIHYGKLIELLEIEEDRIETLNKKLSAIFFPYQDEEDMEVEL